MNYETVKDDVITCIENIPYSDYHKFAEYDKSLGRYVSYCDLGSIVEYAQDRIENKVTDDFFEKLSKDEESVKYLFQIIDDICDYLDY